MRIEPAVALMDLDRVVSEGDEFQVIAGTANAHLAEAGLGPRLAPCVVARLEADAPKASRVRAFGPSQYASSAVCRLTPVEEALAAELDERATKVFQRGDGEGFRTTTSGRSTRSGLICGMCSIASLPVRWCRGPRRGMWSRIGNLPVIWRGATAGPSWPRSWTRRRRCAFWHSGTRRSRTGWPWPTRRRSRGPSTRRSRTVLVCALARAGSYQGLDRRRRAGQRPEGPHERRGSINQCRRWPPRALPAHGRAFRGGDAGAAAAAGVGPDVAPDGAAAAAAFAQPTPAASRRRRRRPGQPERRGPRRVAVAGSPVGHHGEGAVGCPGDRRLGSGQGRADAARRLFRELAGRPAGAPRTPPSGGEGGSSAAPPGDGTQRTVRVSFLCDMVDHFQAQAQAFPR